MREATSNEIEVFKNQFCINNERRIELCRQFALEVESFEELLPGRNIKSYAMGNRLINTSFIIFKVTDSKNEIIYYPVFSESLGRQLAKECNITLPSKMYIFSDQIRTDYKGNCIQTNGMEKKVNSNNLNLRKLIIFARSMMILHVDEPKPMNGVFKEIYDKLESNSNWGVYPSEIYKINHAISSFINSKTNCNHENFRNLNDYIIFIRNKYNNKKIINYDFSILKKLLRENNPNIDIYF